MKFEDRYERLGDWLNNEFESQVAEGRLSVMQDSTHDGEVLLVHKAEQWAIKLQLVTIDNEEEVVEQVMSELLTPSIH